MHHDMNSFNHHFHTQIMDTMATTVFLLSIVSCFYCVTSRSNIYIAGLFPSLPNKLNVPGMILKVGSQLALDHINNDSSILSSFTLNMVYADSKCDQKVSFNSLVKLLGNSPNKLVLYGAACSPTTAFLANLTHMANIVQVTHTSKSTLLTNPRYPSLYRMIPSDFQTIKASLALLNMFNWTTVAVLGEKTQSGLHEDTYNVAMNELTRNNVRIKWSKSITLSEIESTVSDLKNANVRVIFASVTKQFAKEFIIQAFNTGLYSPSCVWIWLGKFPPNWWSDTNFTKTEIAQNAVQYSFSFADNNDDVTDEKTTTISGRTRSAIWKEYVSRLNTSYIPKVAAYSYDGVWFIAKALDGLVKDNNVKLENINTGNETFYQLLKTKMNSVTFSGLTGDFRISSEPERERLDGDVGIYQYDQEGNSVEVMSYDLSFNRITIKYGQGHLWKDNDVIPRDQDNISYRHQIPKQWIFILLTSLCVLSIGLSLVFISHLLHMMIGSKRGRYFASLFNIVSSVGCVCLCTAAIFYGETRDQLEKLNNSYYQALQEDCVLACFGRMATLFLLLLSIDIFLRILWLGEYHR